MFAKEAKATLAVEESDLRGLREARNRVHHQWANALELRQLPPSPAWIKNLKLPKGSKAAVLQPAVIWGWVWINEHRLPPPDKGFEHPKDCAAYVDRLEGKPAHEVLDRIYVGLGPIR